jgi:uncharacterized membrane protein YcaP (DUF421 family)
MRQDEAMSWLTDPGSGLGLVAAKAALMYLVAVLGLRVANRRTLSQWTAIDFAAAVAIGALIGRTAVAGNQSFVVGAVALLTILAAHWVMTMGRFNRWIGKLVDHRVRVLVDHGELRRDQLVLCGLTENDVIGKLREHGVRRLSDLRYVLYETKGELTVVLEDGGAEDAPELVQAGLMDAAGWPASAVDGRRGSST